VSFYRRVWADFHLLYLFLQKSMFNKNYHEEVFSRNDRDNGSCPDGMW
jgi:aquaporin Z